MTTCYEPWKASIREQRLIYRSQMHSVCEVFFSHIGLNGGFFQFHRPSPFSLLSALFRLVLVLTDRADGSALTGWNAVHVWWAVALMTEKAMAPHSSILPEKSHGWRSLVGCSPWGRRVGHNWATSLSHFTFIHWRRKRQPTPVSCLENLMDRGAWWAAVHGVTKSWAQLSD